MRIIAADGTAVGDPDVGLAPDDLRALLRHMILARRLDRECIALQRQGELTVYPGFEGQEAAQVGSAWALGPDDFVFPTFRELAAALVRGVDAVQYLQYHRGTWHGGPYDPRATRFGPICIPIATQISHAVGHAKGQQLDASPDITLAYFGDGSTSEGDFQRGREPGGVWRVPAGAVLPEQRVGDQRAHRAADAPGEIWRRAEGFGMPGVRVDGNDVLAVYAATRDAVARARAGDGPTLIEALTYRIGAHSTADDAGRYRVDDEVEAARAVDPIARYATWLRGTCDGGRRLRRRVRHGGRGVRHAGARRRDRHRSASRGMDVRLDLRGTARRRRGRASGPRRCPRSRPRMPEDAPESWTLSAALNRGTARRPGR